MVLFINETGYIGQAYNGLITITGSTFLALMVVIMCIIALGMMLRIPLEFTSILIEPMLLVLFAFESDLVGVVGAFLLYNGVLLAKNFFFR